MPDQPARRGRPRDADADRRILHAAGRLLATEGYEALAVDRVAELAGVAKTTLYRRWPSKAHLVVELVADLQAQATITETGDLRRDLVGLVSAIAASLNAVGSVMVADLVSAFAREPGLAREVRDLFASRRNAAIEVLRAAHERGELDQPSDPEILVDQLAGPLYYRLLITGDPLTPEYASTLVDSVLGTHTTSP
jgi:AcrR family transcriptional regulator